MMISIAEFFIASGIAISLFVLVYLLKHNGIKLVSGRIAMAIQILWILRFTLFYLKPETEFVYNPYLIMYDQTLFLLDGLMVWLYVRALLRPDKNYKWIWLHFIPFSVVFSFSTAAVVLRPDQVVEQFNKNVELLLRNETSLDLTDIIYVIVLMSINIFYLIRSVKISSSYNMRLKENLSTIDHLTVNWVRKFQNLWIILFIIPLTIFFFNDYFRFTEHLSVGFVTVISFVLLSVVFNFYLLEQVYKPVSIFSKSATELPNETDKEKQEQFYKLEGLLKDNRYYL
ncbi:MAG: hypothetical protein AAGH46_12310, partial [Bacteroidota bacterium]